MSLGLIDLTAHAYYASFSIVAAMGVVRFQQISNHLVSDKGPLEGVLWSLRSGLTEKWMNVVLDLNGLLCVIEDLKSKDLGKECNHYWSHGLSRLAPR